MVRLTRVAIATALAVALVLVAGVASSAQAQAPQSNHGAPFLRAGVHARYFGMGGVGSANANDVGAGYWNPAGLALLRGWSATGMVSSDLGFDRNHSYAAVSYGTEDYALALSWIRAGTDRIDGFDGSGVFTNRFDFAENAILLSVARRSGNVQYGATGKLIHRDLGTAAPGGGDTDVLGGGFDLGAQFYLTPFVRLGIVVQDLVTRIGNESTGDLRKIPANLRFGASMEPLDGILLAIDFEKTRDEDDYRFHAGGEYSVPLGVDTEGAVRLGLDSGEFAGGFGARMGFLRFDYAYVVEPEDFLGEVHRLSLSLDFSERRMIVREGNGDDTDRDGFPDEIDACPGQAEDFDGFEDFDGCPEDDNDADGIPDAEDGCPDEFGPSSSNGCPE